MIEQNMQNSNVVHPNHYQSKNGIEVFDVIKAFTEELNGIESFYVGNILKYICRYKKKNGIEDLEKAKNYLDILINELKGENENAKN